LGAFVIVALLVAGVSYRLVREEPKPASPKNGADVTTPPSRAAPENPQPTGQEPAPATASPAPATGSSQPAKPFAPPAPVPSTPAAPAQPSQVTSPAPPPPSAAPTATMPAEDKMSAANRRTVQEALHRLGYYQGPVDGKFGPLTRGAIRRFQDSIGAKSTGHLTAAEASRLVSRS
jgi:peptidoglycan hydrolase-like protein with peptidoglycan-binding domain